MNPENNLKTRLKSMFPFDWEILRHAGAEPVPHHLKKWWFCIGGTPFYLFFVLAVSGFGLTFYYVPSPDHAYSSVAAITSDVRFGWYVRSIHRWASNLMIVAVFLHLLRVYFTGAYRHPRQLNWCVGLLLLVCTLTFGFTGYSLVYEQLSFWGATVGCNLAEAVPVIGPYVAYFLRGGPEIGANTLTRFFVLHVGILPVCVIALLGFHVLLIRLHGITELQFEGEEVPAEKRHFRFWPDHATTELAIGVLLMYLLTILALVFPAEMGPPADPTRTPPHIKPEWYFYFNFKLLKLTSLHTSVVLSLGLGLVLFFWPFIEERLSRKFKLSDSVPVALGAGAFIVFLVLTIWESYS